MLMYMICWSHDQLMGRQDRAAPGRGAGTGLTYLKRPVDISSTMADDRCNMLARRAPGGHDAEPSFIVIMILSFSVHDLPRRAVAPCNPDVPGYCGCSAAQSGASVWETAHPSSPALLDHPGGNQGG